MSVLEEINECATIKANVPEVVPESIEELLAALKRVEMYCQDWKAGWDELIKRLLCDEKLFDELIKENWVKPEILERTKDVFKSEFQKNQLKCSNADLCALVWDPSLWEKTFFHHNARKSSDIIDSFNLHLIEEVAEKSQQFSTSSKIKYPLKSGRLLMPHETAAPKLFVYLYVLTHLLTGGQCDMQQKTAILRLLVFLLVPMHQLIVV